MQLELMDVILAGARLVSGSVRSRRMDSRQPQSLICEFEIESQGTVGRLEIPLLCGEL